MAHGVARELHTVDIPQIGAGGAAAAGVGRRRAHAHLVGTRYGKRRRVPGRHTDAYRGVHVVAAEGAPQRHIEVCRLYHVHQELDARREVAALHRGAVLLVFLYRPLVEHAFVALVGYLSARPVDFRPGAYGDVGRKAEVLGHESGDGVHIIVRRLALQHQVVVVHPHVAHLTLVADGDTVAAVLLRRRRAAHRLPDKGVVLLRRGAVEGYALIGAGGVAVRGVEVAGSGRWRHIPHLEHEGGRSAPRAVLGSDKVAARMAEGPRE